MNDKYKALDSVLEIAWHFSSCGVDGDCCEDLSFAEFRALQAAVVNRDCSVQKIGEFLGFTKSGATRIVNRLAKRGLVNKERSAADGRVCCVVPTEKGSSVYNDASVFSDSELQKALARLGESEKYTVIKGLGILVQAIKQK
ncbi:MarR family winged helix-turn-helix transcriptional regulator [Desulfovibrio sp. JC010]|uniref:MarR family winged helix-turn-helix transcriptional regulator n=1 Tax=Desulfovibrio sp. JC010 TaxID=2593641 RepID=UPI0013D23BD2|nr:MarR family winged helix-turn-helix transcriptional regulator [Desulfovibrio sp. JC010]NDV25073.1 winged helix-turn-helix transcriptional regulator [Desulfovibrio sp. JC010]